MSRLPNAEALIDRAPLRRITFETVARLALGE